MIDAFGVSKKKDRGWGWDSEEAHERGQENYERKAAYVARKGERRGKNWARLGMHTGVQSGAGALIGGGLAASGARNPRSIAAGAGVGAAAGAATGALTGVVDNDVRAQTDAIEDATKSGDFRAARKGERASQYHNGLIVPKAKYKKAQFKAMQAENESLKERLGSVSKRDAFGVEREDVSKAFSLKPIIGAFKAGVKGGNVPFKPGGAMARSQSAGKAVGAGMQQANAGLKAAGTQVSNFAAAKPKTTIGIGAGAVGGAAGVAGYKTGQRRSY